MSRQIKVVVSTARRLIKRVLYQRKNMRVQPIKTTLLTLLLAVAGTVALKAAEPVFVPGVIRADVFRGFGGTAVTDLTGNAKYPNSPDETYFLKFFEYPPGADDGTAPPGNVADNYGARLYGFIVPKETANYVFYLAADDGAQLWLSTDDNPANKKQIATEPSWNQVRTWTATSRRPGCPDNGGTRCDNQSAPVNLVAGRRYFVEALFKEGIGGDNLAVTWAKQGTVPTDGDAPIGAEFLGALAAAAPAIVTQPADVKQEPGKSATFTVKANDVANPAYQWFKNGTAITGATSASYTTPALAAADNNAKFKVRVTAGSANVESREAVLTVVAVASEVTKGFLKAEVFTDIAGTALDGLRSDVKYTDNKPDRTEIISIFEYPPGTPTAPPAADVANNYGVRVTGFIIPQETASYIFYLAADDNAELYLSTDDKPANEVLIASEPQWNPVRAFASVDRRPGCPDACENISAPIRLEAGKRYWVRGEMKEGGGGDNLAVTWIKQGQPKPADGAIPLNGGVIGVAVNPNLASDIKITTQPKAASVTAPDKATFSVVAEATPSAPLAYQWQKDGVDIPGANGATYTTDFLKTTDGGRIKVIVSVPGKSLASDEVALTVSADTTPPNIARLSGSDRFNVVTVTFSEPVTSATASNRANYAFTGGLTVNTATLVNSTTVRLGTSTQAPDTAYTLTVSNVRDTAANGGNVIAAPGNSRVFNSYRFAQGLVKWEAYTGIGGNTIQALRDSPKYPDSPDETRFVALMEGPTGYAESYGSRLSGWVTPQQNGDYVLFLSTDDGGELWLSTDDNPANKKLIAAETTWSGVRQWITSGGNSDLASKRSDQFTGTEWPGGNKITLQTGKRYYIELLQKEGGGGDNDAATMVLAGTTPADGSSPITGNMIGTFADPNQGKPIITQAPKNTAVASGGTATLTVESLGATPFTYQWRFNGTNIAGATSKSLAISNAGAANVGHYDVVITNPDGSSTSTKAMLFISDALFIEAEDFNFGKGQYEKTKPIGMTGAYPGGDYRDKGDGAGAAAADGTDLGIDYAEATTSNDPGAVPAYRVGTGVEIAKMNAHADGLPRGTFDVKVNHVVGWNDFGDWYNYTRAFPSPAKDYNIVGRLASGGNAIRAQVDEVTGGATTRNQTLKKLGEFKPGRATAGWDNMEFFPLLDDANKLAVANFGGERTFRFSPASGANLDVDYFMFIPVVAGGGGGDGPTLAATRNGANLQITWAGGGTLESADTITGPWTAVAGASSPATVTISGRKFYRVRK
jgi:hypothetical protein